MSGVVNAVRRPQGKVISVATGTPPTTATVQLVDTPEGDFYDGAMTRHVALAIVKHNGMSAHAVTACGLEFTNSDHWARGFGPLAATNCSKCLDRYNDVFRGWETR